jgi:nucleotide-binding universal stress UspA family protein
MATRHSSRFVLGSVSQKILTEHRLLCTSVENIRARERRGERVVVGVDGSTGALTAVRAVAKRSWTPGTELRIVVADDMMKGSPILMLIPPIRDFVDEVRTEERTQSERIALEAAKELRATLKVEGVTVSSAVETGDPKRVLLKHAEEFGADCIFTGATGFSSRLERLVLGKCLVGCGCACSVFGRGRTRTRGAYESIVKSATIGR